MIIFELFSNRFNCTAEEKQAAFKTIKKIIWLAELARTDGVLALEGAAASEEDVFLQHGLLFISEGVELKEWEKYASAWMLADHAEGGRLLEMAVIAEGLSLILRGENPPMILRRLGAWLGSDLAAEVDQELNARTERARNNARKRRMEAPTSALVEFEIFIHRSPDARKRLASRADVQTLACALRGVSGKSYQAIMQELSSVKREELELEMDNMGPIRMCDAENAQRQILSLLDEETS